MTSGLTLACQPDPKPDTHPSSDPSDERASPSRATPLRAERHLETVREVEASGTAERIAVPELEVPGSPRMDLARPCARRRIREADVVVGVT